MRIIGITGKIGSGKTTVADYLVNFQNYTEYSFAEPLKKIAEIFGFSHESLWGTQEQKLQIHPYWKISAREFLQKLGTDVFRNTLPLVIPNMYLENTVWCELFKMKMMEEKNQNNNYVLSDVRFLDEAKAIKDLGGIIIKIQRRNDVVSKNREEIKHSSELELDEIVYDYIIDNNGTINDLTKEIDKIVMENNL